eukprot:955460-Amphidinium_carterae.1
MLHDGKDFAELWLYQRQHVDKYPPCGSMAHLFHEPSSGWASPAVLSPCAQREIASIACVDLQGCEHRERLAQELAARAQQQVLKRLVQEVEEHRGGPVLLQRALHHLARRLQLAHAAAAVREADADDASKPLFERVANAAPLGVDAQLVDLPPEPVWRHGRAAPSQVKLKAGYTYFFCTPSEGAVK